MNERDLMDQGDQHESAYELLQRGQALVRRRHYAQAAIVLERADRIEPGKGSILETLGRAYFNSSQHELARSVFDRLLEIDPSSAYGHYALSRCLVRLDALEAAGTHARLAVALEPGSTLYRAALRRVQQEPPMRGAGVPADGVPADGPQVDGVPADGPQVDQARSEGPPTERPPTEGTR